MELYNTDPPEVSKIGAIGWCAIAGFVAGWDYLAKETLSSSFRRGLENNRTRPLVLGALALTGAHLTGMLPDKLDPFRHLPRRLKSISS